MKLPALFRRRHVWVPTVWSWLLFGLACGLAALFALRHLSSFLAPNEPLGARLLVVEGWIPADELDQALRAYEKGGYQRVVTTGGPVIHPYAPPPAGPYAGRRRGDIVTQPLSPPAHPGRQRSAGESFLPRGRLEVEVADVVTGVSARVLLEIVLMLGLGRPELAGGDDLGDDGLAPLPGRVDLRPD